jgi:hypothetical protein
MASKVLWHVTMSMDGFIAGPDDAMDWALQDPPEPNPAAEPGPGRCPLRDGPTARRFGGG